jgi:WhiB family transcriptional regulator, redox-sensing transcriptional regulator
VKAFTIEAAKFAACGDGPAIKSEEWDSMDWRHRAACRDEDPELFFPIGNTGPALLQIEEAKAVCRRCPVIEPCLAWALETGQDAGVWGGMSEDERRALKRRNARTRARTA